MATPNLPWQGLATHNNSSPSVDSPLSPSGGSATPISFQTNVNRSKTKRWVEAKQVSYDGGDWGDDDDDTDEEEEPPMPVPAPRNPYANHHTTGSSSEISSRRLSGIFYGVGESLGSPSTERKGSGDQSSYFVRPVDHYKRRPSHDVVETPSQYETPPLYSVASNNSTSDTPTASLGSTQDVAATRLPEVKPMAGFSADSLAVDSSIQPNSSTSLSHQDSEASIAGPSPGFTSVVHQAFDVLETPDSTVESLARSDSAGTSIISPIIANGSTYDVRTPTIPEETVEPVESGRSVEAEPVFIPGHRRDMSLPSPDNDPSKKPTVTENVPLPAGQAELSHGSPSSPVSAAKNFVAPLKIGSNPPTDGYRGEIPTIVSVLSPGISPDSTDNDRLREEIMRSLSRENSHEPGEPQTDEPRQPESIPQQYEKFWDHQTGPSPDRASRPLIATSHPERTGNHSLGSQDPFAPIQVPGIGSDAPKKPKLARRFSWESANSGESEEKELQVPGGYTSPPEAATPALEEVEPIPEDLLASEISKDVPSNVGEMSDSQITVDKPRLSLILPISQDNPPPEQIMESDHQSPLKDAPVTPAIGTSIGTSIVDETKLQGFRDILKLTTPADRIRAFEQTRDQFAVVDTGLTHWLQFMVHTHPEYADLVQNQGVSVLARQSPTRSKFPKLSLGMSTSREDSTPANASHMRRGSGHIGTIVNKDVERRGKEFLHTAGTLGGKAGGVAKGFFAKGRSKFRPGDKDQSTSARRSIIFSFSTNASGSKVDAPTRNNSIRLGSLPVFNFGRSETKTAAVDEDDEGERSHKRTKSTGSTDFLRFSAKMPLTKAIENLPSDKSGAHADIAGNFEQEMIDALGLSPKKPQKNLVNSGLDQTSRVSPPVFNGDSPMGTEKSLTIQPSKGLGLSHSDRPAVKLNNLAIPTIRAVVQESNPSSPQESVSKSLTSTKVAPPICQTSAPAPESDGKETINSPGREFDSSVFPQLQDETVDDDPIYSPPLSKSKSIEPFTQFTLSGEDLEPKRRSIGGGRPRRQGSLKKEAKNSNKSSMLSFASFGRRRANSRGTRSSSPANEISQNADMPMKGRRRRRSSVGDLLASIQGGLQGLHEKIRPEELKEEPKQQDGSLKRTFSRMGGFFVRQPSSEPQNNDGAKVLQKKHIPSSPLSCFPSQQNGSSANIASENAVPNTIVTGSASESLAPTDGPRRASLPFPPAASVAAGRFYTDSPDDSTFVGRARQKSLPLLNQPEFSGGRLPPPGSYVRKLENWLTQKERDEQTQRESLSPNPQEEAKLDVARKPGGPRPEPTIGERNELSGSTSIYNGAKTVEPQVGLIKADSSEDLAMSATAYPESDWMPVFWKD